ncbi:uncharacterized protein KNAG_0G02855 [Huiozyma naganishii CBS 8797]|uniref:Uncharacterized protein n=1 Tax=Huiozyma naganishii (strain ATCC MYA-139 / BCRC 22969 / CBS 8797 / KCTC 17520 / NBRC 10181 / NCYC 3082 / Yp74L-3) TaxID=1071383 RepID=J7S185_HUIN7|nr:hypothetical protein KNAG_0G02855 [Kazachstania naganishii CBS 8797]CCK71342.1 hypothetical protein KNAG_0G02855 [Kazachstania naganishii CBS 8797]
MLHKTSWDRNQLRTPFTLRRDDSFSSLESLSSERGWVTIVPSKLIVPELTNERVFGYDSMQQSFVDIYLKQYNIPSALDPRQAHDLYEITDPAEYTGWFEALVSHLRETGYEHLIPNSDGSFKHNLAMEESIGLRSLFWYFVRRRAYPDWVMRCERNGYRSHELICRSIVRVAYKDEERGNGLSFFRNSGLYY